MDGDDFLRRMRANDVGVFDDLMPELEKILHGGVYDFPSFLEEPMHLVGVSVARRALLERRHIATEFLPGNADAVKGVFDPVASLGYHIDVHMLTCDPEEASGETKREGWIAFRPTMHKNTIGRGWSLRLK